MTEVLSVQRFKVFMCPPSDGISVAGMVTEHDGEWVRYADVAPLLEELQAKRVKHVDQMRIPVVFIHRLSDWLMEEGAITTLTMATGGGNVYTFKYKEVPAVDGMHCVVDVHLNEGED